MKKLLVVFSVLSLLAASCARESNLDMSTTPREVDADFAIVPSAMLGGMFANSRAEGVIEPDAATDLPVSVFRVDKEADAYPADLTEAAGPLAAALQGNTTTTAPDAKINFDAAAMQYYLSDGTPTKVLALHPAITAGQWTAATGVVTYTIDGKTDIMVTKWGEGYKNLSVNPVVAVQPANMEFTHLLTQVHVQVYAEDAVSQGFWGDVKSISIRGRAPEAAVTLPVVTESTFPTLAATGTAVALPVFQLDGTAAPTLDEADVPLKDNSEDPAAFGYCMFAPIAPAAELELTVVTEKSGVESTTNLLIATAQTYDAETAYTITLLLTAKAIVPEGVTIREWQQQTIAEIEI